MLVEITHKHNTLTIVDAVTSLGGVPVLVDERDVDAAARGRARERVGASPPSHLALKAGLEAMGLRFLVKEQYQIPCSVLADLGLPVHVGDAEAAAHNAYAHMHTSAAQSKRKPVAAAA